MVVSYYLISATGAMTTIRNEIIRLIFSARAHYPISLSCTRHLLLSPRGINRTSSTIRFRKSNAPTARKELSITTREDGTERTKTKTEKSDLWTGPGGLDAGKNATIFQLRDTKKLPPEN